MTKEILSPKEILDLVPMMKVDDVIHGFWTPDEGRANPVDVTMSMAKGARQRGAQIFEETEVIDFVDRERPDERRRHRSRHHRVRKGHPRVRALGP